MFGKLLPKKPIFFDYFEQHAGLVVESARVFHLAVNEKDFLNQLQKIKHIEHQADEIVRRCAEELHRTFITPFDREDIHHLISKMDDVVDSIDDAADCIVMYRIEEISQSLKHFSSILYISAQALEKAVGGLRNLKNITDTRKECLQIHQYEHDADEIYRNAVSRLFEDEHDLRLLIKWKEIYQILENACDQSDDVANLVEGIILDYF